MFVFLGCEFFFTMIFLAMIFVVCLWREWDDFCFWALENKVEIEKILC